MAESIEQVLTVWTTQATFKNPDLPEARVPFSRIIAMETSPGRIATCKDIERLGKTALSAWATRTIRLASPEQAARVKAYFEEVIAPNDTYVSGRSRRPENRYNCHSFAMSVSGENGRLNGSEAWKAAAKYYKSKKYEVVQGQLAIGEHGLVIATRAIPEHEVPHSVIGLENDECLGVECADGPLTIMSRNQVLHNYRYREPLLATPLQDEDSGSAHVVN